FSHLCFSDIHRDSYLKALICMHTRVQTGNIMEMMVSCFLDQDKVYTTVLFVPMAFLLRMLMAYSPRLVPFSSFRSGFL
ncbi:hypothetical protein XENOCAPTIV_001601, partial [Xenoophorus captivus]